MRRALIIAAVAFASAAVLTAQSSPPRIWQGVYTAAQADRGKASFTTTCLRCHNADLSGDRGPALRGDRFMTTWGGGSVTRLFEKIRDTMPPFATSTLDDKTKLDIVTYILQVNGFPAADKELAVEDLEAIEIVPQGQQPTVQNFSRVQVVGCLARGDADKWVLANSSEPAVAADNTAASPTPALGTGRLVLLNAAQFEPEKQLGNKIEARGLIYRDERETLLTVAALRALGPCDR
jgi:S-disulfanyl-L-cysteine oxidoreductase SoxD